MATRLLAFDAMLMAGPGLFLIATRRHKHFPSHSAQTYTLNHNHLRKLWSGINEV